MIVEVTPSRSGLPFARINGKALHSPYNPQREAERFLDSRGEENAGTVLILGPGLNYLYGLCSDRYPNAKIVSIYYQAELYRRRKEGLPFHHLFSDSSSLRNFLHEILNDIDLEGLTVIEWPRSAELFPDISSHVNKTVKEVLQQLHGNFITSDQFGRKWVLNAVKNCIYQYSPADSMVLSKPLFIAASGPSLENSLDLLADRGGKFHVVSLPSSIDALRSRGIKIDFIILTDAGYSTRHHLHSLNGSGQESAPLLLRSLSSHFSSFMNGLPSLFFASPGGIEELFIRTLYDTPLFLPPNGTVAGTAFELFRTVPSLPVYFAGLDFDYTDVRSHVRPHPFYNLYRHSDSRVSPFLSQIFERRVQFRSSSRAFSTYLSWFNSFPAADSSKVYRVCPSRFDIPCMKNLTSQEFALQTGALSENDFPKTLLHFPRSRTPVHESLPRLVGEWTKTLQRLTVEELAGYLTQNGRVDFIYELIYFLNPVLFKRFKKALRMNSSGEIGSIFSNIRRDSLDFLSGITQLFSNHGK
jgi:hypothetical protein